MKELFDHDVKTGKLTDKGIPMRVETSRDVEPGVLVMHPETKMLWEMRFDARITTVIKS